MTFITYNVPFKKGEIGTPDHKGPGGVKVYNPEKSYHGYTLFCRSGGDHFYLVDMEGNVVHSWQIKHSSIHFGQLTEEGHLIYSTADRTIEENRGVYELDWQGNKIWYYPCPVDHDHRLLDNGNILILCREEIIDSKVRKEIWPDYRACFSPYIIEVTKNKEIVWEWHGKDHIEELTELVGLKFPHDDGERSRDWAHCNTASPIPKNKNGEKDLRFREGNIIISYRELNVIGVIDKESKKIVWAWGTGEILGQHNPIMLKNGHILLFDNGCHSSEEQRGYSRVIELDPLSEKIVWEYKDNPPEKFYSPYVSGQQELPNGNILICSGGQGRIIEITREKEIVWEYINPFYGPNGHNGLYRHSGRYSPEIIEPLLKK